MKFFIVALCIFSNTVFATQTLDLKEKEMSYSIDGSEDTFEIIRTIDTPKTVKLTFYYSYTNNVCLRSDTREHWVEGYHREWCESDSVHCYERNGRRICERVEGECHREWISGHYETEVYCVEYGTVQIPTSKKIKLNFKKAHKLSNNDSERFNVTIKQPSHWVRKLKISGKTIETAGEYKIKEWKFLFFSHQLKFKKK
ncbi:MAG: hypothetical protein KAQ98_00105 [Bacteriovoracaceae bacterium]|nr:hypothetical protein [Bacteriovoracaceae bacterium]